MLLSLAETTGKTQLLGLSVSEIIAKEFYFHRTCYRHISRPDKNTDSEEFQKREECFSDLKIHIKNMIFERRTFTTVNQLSSYYEKLQVEKNIQVKGASNKDIKLRLKTAFGEDLTLHQGKKGLTEYVYHKSVPIEEDDRSWFFLTEIEKVKKVAEMTRTQIEHSGSPFTSWPPHPDEIRTGNVEIPTLLGLFLKGLFTKQSPVSEKVNRLIKSIGQDIIYSSTHGKIKTIKHVQLGILTKRKTGSKFLINSLNRLGHSISYDEINNVETSFAELQSQQQNHRSFVPNNIQPSTFLTFVFDNCDHNPESLTGISMHCTNGIIIQKPTVTAQIVDHATPIRIDKSKRPKRRSFTPLISEIQPYYQPSTKANPTIIDSIERNTNKFNELLSMKADFLWIVARYYQRQLQSNEQLIPGWTGFHHEVTNTDTPTMTSNIYYLPTINKSPTKMDTVQEILFQVKAKSEALNLTAADLVLDHAIFCKALDIMMDPRNLELRNFINIRMGGFHVSCIFIAVIGKRFAAAGLRDIIIEAGLTGQGAVESVLKGKQYNRAVRVLKFVYEALQRLKFDTFEEWLLSQDKERHLTNFLESLEFNNLLKGRNTGTFQNSMNAFKEVFSLFQQFEAEVLDKTLGPMALFWNSFIKMVQILLDYIKSIRTGDWDLHLQASERMLAWFHAYDRVNYSRHFTYNWAAQQKLRDKHPEIYQEFQSGNFSVKRTAGSFNMLPPDQVIEQTINKEQKGSGGIIGISTSVGAVQRWILSSHITAAISTDFKECLGLIKSKNVPKDLGKRSRLRLIALETKAAIIGISESKIDDTVLDAEIEIEGYALIRSDRNRHGGGIVCYIRDNINYNLRPNFSKDFENIVLDMLLPNTKPILVGIFYNPPNKKGFLENLNTAILATKSFNEQEVFFLGDLNINLLKKKDKNVSNSKVSNEHIQKQYQDLCSSHGMKQLITEPTRINETLLLFLITYLQM